MRPVALGFWALLVACGGPTPRAQVTVVVRGEDAPVRQVVARADMAVQLRLAEPPVPEEQPAPAPLDLSATRDAYVDLRVDECLAGLGDATAVDRRLVAEQPRAAGRLLFWRAACEFASGDLPAAGRTAERLAVLGLPVPDLDRANAAVEGFVAERMRDVSRRPLVPVQLTSDPEGARVLLDGRVRSCATPCTLRVFPGRHVFVMRRDGYADAAGSFEAGGGETEVSSRLRPAAPAVAARQWRSRGQRRASLDDPVSMAVLATAVRAERLLLLEPERHGDGRSVRAALFVDGLLSARAERLVPSPSELDSEVEGLITDVLERGEVLRTVPVHEEPLFWITVFAVVALATGVSAGLLYEPEIRYEIAFRR